MPERGADPTNTEVEWQYDALDLRPVERWLDAFPRTVPGKTDGTTVVVTVVGQPVKRTVDIYLDTDDWRIGRSSLVLRIRHHDDLGEITLKDTTPAVAGLRRRLELTEPLPAGGLHSLGPTGPVGARLRALAGDATLSQLVEVRTRRRPYRLCVGDELAAEVDLDDTIIVVGDDDYPVRMRRVEVEADPRWVDRLTPLVERLREECALQPAILSKFEVGLLAADLHIPTRPELGPVELGPEPSVGEVAYAVLRRNLAAMLDHEPGTRLGQDIEELHDMRVATRRMRAALALFTDVLPGVTERLEEELGWLASELGAVRDLDVQLERLQTWGDELPGIDDGALTELARLLEDERSGARENLLVSLDSSRYRNLVSDLTAMLTRGPQSARHRAGERATTVVPELIMGRHGAAAKAARRARRSGAPADFHRLRIRCKRLRYALEFVSVLYGDRSKAMVKRIVKLQDSLGLLQDSEVAAGRLKELVMTEDSGLSPATIFTMGRVAEGYAREAQRMVETIPDHLRDLEGAQWRKLKKSMERRALKARTAEASSRSPSVRTSPGSAGPSAPAPDHPAGVGHTATERHSGRTAPWEHGAPAPFDDPGDDLDWDDDAPTLRAVPAEPGPDSDPPGLADTLVPAPTREASPPGGRRRKEPVFLPAPVAPARPAPMRTVRRPDPPDDGGSRSFHDRP